jgi:hypothetical protein
MDRRLSPMGMWEIAVAEEIDHNKLRAGLRNVGNELWGAKWPSAGFAVDNRGPWPLSGWVLRFLL